MKNSHVHSCGSSYIWTMNVNIYSLETALQMSLEHPPFPLIHTVLQMCTLLICILTQSEYKYNVHYIHTGTDIQKLTCMNKLTWAYTHTKTHIHKNVIWTCSLKDMPWSMVCLESVLQSVRCRLRLLLCASYILMCICSGTISWKVSPVSLDSCYTCGKLRSVLPASLTQGLSFRTHWTGLPTS